MPVWAIAVSSASGGQALDCTPGMKGDRPWTDCDLLWFALCQNCMEKEAGNNMELCSERSDRSKRGKKLDYLLQPSLDFYAV